MYILPASPGSADSALEVVEEVQNVPREESIL